MFSDLILRNSKRSRKENGLFFSSLVISIVAFYIILSISKQDVMIFLQKMESDAVSRLLMMVPVFYIMTLVILFFLIYFACKYQLQRRRHEFGVYLMMGMEKNKLFSMLLAEDTTSSLLALLIGLPIAVLLSEIISLVTAKTVGMGIIGHRFSLSVSALVFTIVGFLAIKLVAFSILSAQICRQEIGILLGDEPKFAKKKKPMCVYMLALAAGTIMLGSTYYLAVSGRTWKTPLWFGATALIGLLGTVFLFYGMGILIKVILKAGSGKLRVFNFRQIEESVIQQYTTMAISSLLILAALCCFGAGVGISETNTQKDTHLIDYTFVHYGNLSSNEIFPKAQSILRENGLEEQFSGLHSMRIGNINTTEEFEGVFRMDSVMNAIRELPESEAKTSMLYNLSYTDYPSLICLSDYNEVMKSAGVSPIYLAADEAAVYMDTDFTDDTRTGIFNKILASRPKGELDGSEISLVGEVQTANLVADSSITLSFALILPDEQFRYYTQDRYSVYVNAVLKPELVENVGLMQAISAVNDQLDQIGLSEADFRYESYLESIGRQIFFLVSSSYITIYLAIIFLVVANTILGVQFLMSQRKSGRRYKTLVRLGADYPVLRKSGRKQVQWFMGLPVFVAVVSSIFGVRALYSGLLPSSAQGKESVMLLISAAMILLLLVVEYIYITVVKRSSDRYLLTLMQPKREE